MSLTKEQDDRAITRNLYELGHARFEYSVRVAFENFESDSEKLLCYPGDKPFFKIVLHSLFSSMIGHAVKVMDRHPRCASFWAIFRTDESKIRTLRSFSEEALTHITELTKKLQKVRNKTFAHIDPVAVFDPQKVWKEAGIAGDELGRGLSHLWSLLSELHQDVQGRPFLDPCEGYDASDVKTLLSLSVANGLLIQRSKVPAPNEFVEVASNL